MELVNMYFIVPLICNGKVKINNFEYILLDIWRIFNFPLCFMSLLFSEEEQALKYTENEQF